MSRYLHMYVHVHAHVHVHIYTYEFRWNCTKTNSYRRRPVGWKEEKGANGRKTAARRVATDYKLTISNPCRKPSPPRSIGWEGLTTHMVWSVKRLYSFNFSFTPDRQRRRQHLTIEQSHGNCQLPFIITKTN